MGPVSQTLARVTFGHPNSAVRGGFAPERETVIAAMWAARCSTAGSTRPRSLRWSTPNNPAVHTVNGRRYERIPSTDGVDYVDLLSRNPNLKTVGRHRQSRWLARRHAPNVPDRQRRLAGSRQDAHLSGPRY
ncbi:hypothetical protein HMPREF9622_01870 [Cutibacterium modestum HL037PA3]|nr:hypothetical protein HMPREF9622_01870 [Cutibacterium modestum HL037PA3]